MKSQYLLTLFICIIISCSNNKYSGFRMEIKCLHDSKEGNIIVFYDTMLTAVNWKKQTYYFKDSINHIFLNNKICYGGCLLTTYINDEKCYDAIIECSISSNNLDNSFSPNTIWFLTNNKANYLLKKDRIDLFPEGEDSEFLFNKLIKKYMMDSELLITDNPPLPL